MMFELPRYLPPDFCAPGLENAPDATFFPAPMDGVAPEGYHATSIYPEYFKRNGRWILAAESRMDCVAVARDDGSLTIREFRNLKAGDPVALGRTEHGRGWRVRACGRFSARSGRTRAIRLPHRPFARDVLFARLRPAV